MFKSQYDTEQGAAYDKVLAAEELIRNRNKKGFPNPSYKKIEEATALINSYGKEKAGKFLDEYKLLCLKFGIQLKPSMKELQHGSGLYQAKFELDEYVPEDAKKAEEPKKPAEPVPSPIDATGNTNN